MPYKKETIMQFRLKIFTYLLLVMATGCAGLKQFPEATIDFNEILYKKDPGYAVAISKISKPNSDKVTIRNRMIDERLRVIDIYFGEFQKALSRENVTANFGVAVAQVLVGGVGSLTTETISQILSATSGGLVGAQQAYSKSALFEQTMPALLAQMIAARKSILAEIMEGRKKSIVKYPLSAAARDIEAYYFAGSVPGAILATSADAKVKNDMAESRLESLRSNVFDDSESKELIQAFIYPPDGDSSKSPDSDNLKAVKNWIKESPVKGLPIANFLTNKELEPLRENMIQDLSIQKRR
jgi:hypothetical protein